MLHLRTGSDKPTELHLGIRRLHTHSSPSSSEARPPRRARDLPGHPSESGTLYLSPLLLWLLLLWGSPLCLGPLDPSYSGAKILLGPPLGLLLLLCVVRTDSAGLLPPKGSKLLLLWRL